MCIWTNTGDIYSTECGRIEPVLRETWQTCPNCGENIDTTSTTATTVTSRGDLLIVNLHQTEIQRAMLPYFEAAGGGGYTNWIDDAKRFTRDSASEFLTNQFYTEYRQAVPLEIVEKLSRRTVLMRELRDEVRASTIAAAPRDGGME